MIKKLYFFSKYKRYSSDIRQELPTQPIQLYLYLYSIILFPSFNSNVRLLTNDLNFSSLSMKPKRKRISQL